MQTQTAIQFPYIELSSLFAIAIVILVCGVVYRYMQESSGQ